MDGWGCKGSGLAGLLGNGLVGLFKQSVGERVEGIESWESQANRSLGVLVPSKG